MHELKSSDIEQNKPAATLRDKPPQSAGPLGKRDTRGVRSASFTSSFYDAAPTGANSRKYPARMPSGGSHLPCA